MTNGNRSFSALALTAALLGLAACATDPALQAKVAELETRLERQEDVEAVRRAAHSYGYFMDNAMMQEVTDLLSPNVEFCEIAGYGRYNGHAGCLKIWRDILGPGLQNASGQLRFGRLIKHYLVKDLISVAPDGRTAEGRFDYIGYSGVLGQPTNSQQLGVYRFGFTKEGGVWKITRFQLTFDTSDWNDRDWATATNVRCRSTTVAPDGPPSLHHPFPETAVAPFADPHPVTGKPIPSHVNPTRYWTGNWPGEFGGPCGVRPGAPKTIEPGRGAP